MKTSFTQTHDETEFAFEGDFFDLYLVVGSGGDGNSAHPCKVTVRADQMDAGSPGAVTFGFVGEMEFLEFRRAIALLAMGLEAVFGDPLSGGRS